MAGASSATGDTWRGFGFALTAYLLWGFLPFFMKLVAHIPPVEVVAHRIIWSVPIAAGGAGADGADCAIWGRCCESPACWRWGR